MFTEQFYLLDCKRYLVLYIIKNILITLPTGKYWYYTDKCDHLFKESIDTDGPHEDAHMLTHPISVIYLNV